MIKRKDLIKETNYLIYVIFSGLSIISLLTVIISMSLWNLNNNNVNLYISIAQLFSHIIMFSGVIYEGVWLIRKLSILKVFNLSFYTFIGGIVIAIISIIVGISSAFVIGNHNDNVLWNGLNLIWIVPMIVNTIIAYISYRLDLKNNIIFKIENGYIQSDVQLANTDDQSNYYTNHYKINEINKNKQLLTKQDYNKLITLSSFIILFIIGFIVLSVFINDDFENKIQKVDIVNGSELKTMTPFGYGMVFIMLLSIAAFLISIIGSFYMGRKIFKKLKRLEDNKKLGYMTYIVIVPVACFFAFIIFVVILIVLAWSVYFPGRKFDSTTNIALLTMFGISCYASIIAMILSFVLSILAKSQAIKFDYFQKSQALFLTNNTQFNNHQGYY